MFQIQEAKREKIWTKTALMGPSGSGKTYSSLRLATGMLEELTKTGDEKNGRILLANTESSRGRYYANEFKYDITDLGAPFNPELFVDLIKYAVEQNYPILIIDSTSREWEGKGGCLELHQAAGGTYQSWAKVTPRHDKFLEAIADEPIHVIATMRGKDQYELGRDDDNRMYVKKLGVGAKQREGFEYEFTISFLLDQATNMAVPQKDNTHLFEDDLEYLLSEKHGVQLIKWAGSGEGYTPPVRNRETEEDKIRDLQKMIIEKAKELGGQNNEALMNLIREYATSGNPNRIKDLGKLTELNDRLETIVKLEEQEESKEVPAEETEKE
jgi:hypothetical protein